MYTDGLSQCKQSRDSEGSRRVGLGGRKIEISTISVVFYGTYMMKKSTNIFGENLKFQIFCTTCDDAACTTSSVMDMYYDGIYRPNWFVTRKTNMLS